ncbi:hypothetical protein F5B19DRAFT_47180 [Rostrohypoxylon terebratum]|nr:hypothetical protein F5B19DRAFT_47180 [Rostrohypoxylon terebratum]
MASKSTPKPANKGTANGPSKGQKPKSEKPKSEEPKSQKPKYMVFIVVLSIVLWFAVAGLGFFIALGCLFTNSLYIIQVHSNDTTPVQVQVGYFGTCVSTDAIVSDVYSNTTNTTCVQNIQYDDDELLVSQFMAEIRDKNPSTNMSAIEEPLGKILPVAEQLRRNAFPGSLPISFLVIYILSIIFFWILLASSNHSRTYRAIFAITALLNSYGLTIGFIMATTTVKASMALIFPSQDDTGTIQDGIFVTQNTAFQTFQWITVGLSVALQLCISLAFVLRRLSCS